MKTNKTDVLIADEIGAGTIRKTTGICWRLRWLYPDAPEGLNFTCDLTRNYPSWFSIRTEIQWVYADLFVLYQNFERHICLIEKLLVFGLVNVFENNVFSQDRVNN